MMEHWSQAVARLRRSAPALVATGRGGELLDWTDSFPPALRAGEPWVLHYQAVGLRLTRTAYAAAFRMQEQARDAFLAEGQRYGATCAVAELGLLAALLDRLAEAKRFLEHARAELGECDRFLLPSIRSTLAEVNLALDRHEKTRADKELRSVADSSLLGRDDLIRSRLARALADDRITPRGLAMLRDQYGLTPAETNVFVEYYLTTADAPDSSAEPKRRALARELNLSENTLMHHITSIRRKLGLVARNGSATVLIWCLTSGITNLRPVLSEHHAPLRPALANGAEVP